MYEQLRRSPPPNHRQISECVASSEKASEVVSLSKPLFSESSIAYMICWTRVCTLPRVNSAALITLNHNAPRTPEGACRLRDDRVALYFTPHDCEGGCSYLRNVQASSIECGRYVCKNCACRGLLTLYVCTPDEWWGSRVVTHIDESECFPSAFQDLTYPWLVGRTGYEPTTTTGIWYEAHNCRGRRARRARKNTKSLGMQLFTIKCERKRGGKQLPQPYLGS